MSYMKRSIHLWDRITTLSHKSWVAIRGEKSSKLSMLDYETIKAELFYKILNNRELLPMLIQGNEKNGLSKTPKLTEQQQLELEERWCEIEHEYHIKSKNSEYESSLEQAKQNILEQSKLLKAMLLFQKYRYGIKEGIDGLAKMGVKGNMDDVVRKINQMIGKVEMRRSKNAEKTANQDGVDFFELIAKVNTANGFHVPSDIMLKEWVGVLAVIKTKK